MSKLEFKKSKKNKLEFKRGERWKDLDFLDLSPIYQVSDRGRVRNRVTGKIMKYHLSSNPQGNIRPRISLSTYG